MHNHYLRFAKKVGFSLQNRCLFLFSDSDILNTKLENINKYKSIFNIDVSGIKSARQKLMMLKMILKFIRNKLCLKKRQKLDT